METQIKVYDDKAKLIKPGDIFVPVFEWVEGHTVVSLRKSNTIPTLLEMYDTQKIDLDGLVKGLRGMVVKDD